MEEFRDQLKNLTKRNGKKVFQHYQEKDWEFLEPDHVDKVSFLVICEEIRQNILEIRQSNDILKI